MQPDALPQLIETLLRLPFLEAAQLKDLLQHLPDPQASAQEMLSRGWITQDQFSSLFPGPRQRPTTPETILVGFGDDELPPDAEGEDWELPVSEEEDPADMPPVEESRPDRAEEEMLPEPATGEAVPVLSGTASTPPFEWDALVVPVAGGNEAPRRESDTDKRLRQWMGRASKGLLMWSMFLGSFFAGLQLLRSNSTVPPVARQESREATKKSQVPTVRRGGTRPQLTAEKGDKVQNNKAAAGEPAGAADLPPALRILPVNAKQLDDLRNSRGQNAQPAAPRAPEAPVPAAAPARANDAEPIGQPKVPQPQPPANPVPAGRQLTLQPPQPQEDTLTPVLGDKRDIVLIVKNATDGRLGFELFWGEGKKWRRVTLQPGEIEVIPCKADDDVGYACYYSRVAGPAGQAVTGHNSAVTPSALRSSQTWTFVIGNNPLGQDNPSIRMPQRSSSDPRRGTLVRRVSETERR